MVLRLLPSFDSEMIRQAAIEHLAAFEPFIRRRVHPELAFGIIDADFQVLVGRPVILALRAFGQFLRFDGGLGFGVLRPMRPGRLVLSGDEREHLRVRGISRDEQAESERDPESFLEHAKFRTANLGPTTRVGLWNSRRSR